MAVTWGGEVPCHPGPNYVYVEVPKAGATSIMAALTDPPAGEDVHRWAGYVDAASVADMYRWLRTRWLDLFSFTVVRDPIARFVSFYRSLDGPQAYWGDVDRYVLTRFEHTAYVANIHAVPQTRIIGTDLRRFNYVGWTEHMDKVEAILRTYVDPDLKIGHLNASWTDAPVIGPRARARLRDLYRTDYEAFRRR